MFEKFTERARKAMFLARQEAQRLNHEQIATEHVLLGILQEGGGVAAKALKKLTADPARIRQEVEKRLPPPSTSPVQLGMIPFSTDGKRAIEFAGEAASRLGHDTIGTEHLLLGLLRVFEGIAAQSLRAVGLEDAPLLAAILETLGPDPAAAKPQPPRDLQRHALGIRPLTDRPSVQGPLAALLLQGRSVALVGPKRVGKTSIVLAMARVREGSFLYWCVDHRMFDEFIAPAPAEPRLAGMLCFVPQAELLTASRSFNANLLEDRMTGGERLILEFREGDLEKFAARYNFIAKDLVTVEVKPPDADECRGLLDAARTRLKRSANLDIADDVLAEADRQARDRWRHLVPPWPTIMTLWAAEAIHRETSARGDEQQLLKDIADLEATDPAQAEALKRHLEGLRSIVGTSALSIESVRRAIGELSGPSQS